MSAVVTATVIRWQVDWGTEPPTMYCDQKDTELMSAFVSDGAGSDVTPIIAQYIRKRAGDDGNGDDTTRKDLLKAAADGLLQVVVHQRVGVTAPPLPPRGGEELPLYKKLDEIVAALKQIGGQKGAVSAAGDQQHR